MEKKILKRSLLAILFSFFLISANASAELMTEMISNGDFSSAVGWTFTTGSGIWTSPTETLYLGYGAVAKVNNGSSFSQTLSDQLIGGNTYTVSFDVGLRSTGTQASYSVELYAGTDLLASRSNVFTEKGFHSDGFSYSALADGGALQLVFRNTGNLGNQVNFDNVSLVDPPNGPTATPIPAPFLLLGTGLIGLAGFRRKMKS